MKFEYLIICSFMFPIISLGGEKETNLPASIVVGSSIKKKNDAISKRHNIIDLSKIKDTDKSTQNTHDPKKRPREELLKTNNQIPSERSEYNDYQKELTIREKFAGVLSEYYSPESVPYLMLYCDHAKYNESIRDYFCPINNSKSLDYSLNNKKNIIFLQNMLKEFKKEDETFLMLWGEKMRFTFRSPLDQQRKIYSLFENLRTQQQASYLIGRFSALKAFSFAIEEYIRQENESKEQQDKSKKKKKN